MSNSFNISVKPEIAALEAKVDIVDTVADAIKNDTGPIRNDVTAIHDTNLPAVKVDTGAIRNDVTAIHDTNLPAVKQDTGAIRNDVTDIHDTNLPAVKIDTVAILNRANAIKVKTDAFPQNVRGKYYPVTLATAASSYQYVCNVSGHGVLFALNFAVDNAGDTISLSLTIDGNAFTVVTHTGDAISQALVPYSHYIPAAKLNKFPDPPTTISIFSIEFSESLIVQIKRSAGSASTVRAVAHYSLDEF